MAFTVLYCNYMYLNGDKTKLILVTKIPAKFSDFIVKAVPQNVQPVEEIELWSITITTDLKWNCYLMHRKPTNLSS